MGAITIGVDIGQKRDPTAICVVESEIRRMDTVVETHFLVRHIGRLPLMTPYPDVARRVAGIAGGVKARLGRAPVVYVDATGVGQPIVDELRKGSRDLRTVVAVYFVHGDRRTEENPRGKDPQVKLGKAYLVGRLQSLLQSRRIHLPSNPETKALADELQDYEIRVSREGTDRYGAYRPGAHDDLVTALGLAVQTDRAFGPRAWAAALRRPPGL